MTKTVCITTGNYDSSTCDRIDPAHALVRRAYEHGHELLVRAYEQGHELLWQAYEEARAPLWQTYMAAPARTPVRLVVYEQARAPLLRAYTDAHDLLLQAYTDAHTLLWQAYKAAQSSINSSTCDRIDPALAVVAKGAQAYPTSRVLDGGEEWREAATLPDGRACYRVYLFDEDDVTDGDGETLDAENYPWDDDHVARIILADD